MTRAEATWGRGLVWAVGTTCCLAAVHLGIAWSTLEELVPKYLPAIPLTGAAICPEFSYGGDGRSWHLAVGLTQWVLDDTRLLYRSDGQPADCGYRAWKLCG